MSDEKTPIGIEFLDDPDDTEVECVECGNIATIAKFKAQPYWCEECTDFHVQCPFCDELMPSVYIVT